MADCWVLNRASRVVCLLFLFWLLSCHSESNVTLPSGLRISAAVYTRDSAGRVEIVNQIRLTNPTVSSIDGVRSACPATLLAYRSLHRHPVWNEARQPMYDCPAIAIRMSLRPNETFSLNSYIRPNAILGDSLRAGTYDFESLVNIPSFGINNVRLYSGSTFVRRTKRY